MLIGYVSLGNRSLLNFKKYGGIEKTDRLFLYLTARMNTTDETPPRIDIEEYVNEKSHLIFFEQLLSSLQAADAVVLTSILDLSSQERSAIQLYTNAWHRQIDLIFLDQPWLNSALYRKHNSPVALISDQIYQVYYRIFSEKKEIADAQKLSQQRRSASSTNSDYAHNKGKKLVSKKSKQIKPIILARSRDFNGHEMDTDLMEHLGIARATYYKYKREIRAELMIAKAAKG